MNCPRCGSNNIQITMQQTSKKVGKGCAYWFFIGWWLEPILWIFFTVPMLILAVFRVGRKTETVSNRVAVCQWCGNYWRC